MAIQMRRGSIVDFDPSKMVPGEWAIPYDNNDIIFICTSQGHVVEIASTSISRAFMENAEAWAVGEKNGIPVSDTDIQYENNSKYYAGQANTSATNAATYAEKAEEYKEQAAAIVGIGIATTTTPGIVKPDGTSITIDNDGTIHGGAQVTISGKKVIVS